MRRLIHSALLAAAVLGLALPALTQSGPYKIITTAKVGGEGGFDYVWADSVNRKLYIPRSGATPRITVFDLDRLTPAGEVPNFSAHGAVVDPKSGHGFATSKPVVEFDAKTLATIKTIPVDGGPDGILEDAENGHVYILSHRSPNITVINAMDGTVAGTIDLGGAPEQSVTDGKGHIYIDLEDKGAIAVVDANSMKLITTYSLKGKGDGCAGLALDAKNGILFAACRNPQVMVILKTDGTLITTLPIGRGCDGAVFNPATMETFSSQGDGTLTIIKESSPSSFAVEQTVATPMGAKTLTLDSKTGHILLISAAYGPAPVPVTPPAPGTRPARGTLLPGSFSIVEVGK
jgi:DNA-binding beta-propeller fold protein YncE